ncbi:MAG: hypothetical protein ACK4PI_00740 [Tepidisphaerales bacterium]
MFRWDGDLRLTACDLFLDARQPRPWCFVSHAHTDHLADHQHGLMTPETAHLLKGRAEVATLSPLPYQQETEISRQCRIRLLPAGHVLGSAMLHVRVDDESLLYTGDFKLRTSPLCPPADPLPADHLLMECTYGLPRFRFPPPASVEAELVERCARALAGGVQPVVFAYALGKAQHALKVLTDSGLPVTLHGAVANVTERYAALGVSAGSWRRYQPSDFHGPDALPLTERGVLIAPPGNARTAFTTRFKRRWTVMLSGWGMDPSAKYRYGVDDVLPLSDHADHAELWETIERVAPRVVWLQHGFVREFMDELRGRGMDARPARPLDQLELF